MRFGSFPFFPPIYSLHFALSSSEVSAVFILGCWISAIYFLKPLSRLVSALVDCRRFGNDTNLTQGCASFAVKKSKLT